MPDEDVAERALTSVYAAVLRDGLGLECTLEDFGWLGVHALGRWFVVMFDVCDPGFLRVATSASWPAGSARHRTAAAARANRSCKGIKLTLAEESAAVVVAAEMIVGTHHALPDAAHLAVVLDRSLTDIAAALLEFHDELLLCAMAESVGCRTPAHRRDGPDPTHPRTSPCESSGPG